METDNSNYQRLNLDTLDFTHAGTYTKTSLVNAHQVVAKQRVETTLADGLLETSQDVEAGYWVVTNPGGEEYAMSPQRFQEFYRETEEEGVYQSIATARAMRNPTGVPIVIRAPWGERQWGEKDCWILEKSGKRYLCGADEFAVTYEPAE